MPGYLKEVAFEVSCALPFQHTSFLLFVLRVIMSRSLDECDAILADMCDCYRMSVERTRWYGDNIGCHFRECAEDVVVVRPLGSSNAVMSSSMKMIVVVGVL